MGGTISYDFCDVVRNHLLQKDVDPNDTVLWKTVFCTDMHDSDIVMYLNWNSVRLMRRNKPNNLALLAYRCMQQLAAFLDKATMPGATVSNKNVKRDVQNQQHAAAANSTASAAVSVPSPSSATSSASSEAAVASAAHAAADSFVDPCSANNALRILTQIMPVIFESDIVVEQTVRPSFLDDDDDSQSVKCEKHAKKKAIDDLIEKLLALPKSPFADDFAQLFLNYNLRCDTRVPAGAYPPLFHENARRAEQNGWTKEHASPASPPSSSDKTSGDGTLPVPLGEELIVLLTRVCFIPGWSVEYGSISTSAMRFLRGVTDENTRCGADVIAELLDHEGLFRHAAVQTVTAGTADGDAAAAGAKDNSGDKKSTDASSSSTVGAKLFNTVFSFDVLHNKIQLLRCLIACLSKGPILGHAILDDPRHPIGGGNASSSQLSSASATPASASAASSPSPAAATAAVAAESSRELRCCFQDGRRNPLALTLVVSCLNFICTYTGRGVLPYSSHYFADVPEKMLSTCIEFALVSLAFPPDCCVLDEAAHATNSCCAGSAAAAAAAAGVTAAAGAAAAAGAPVVASPQKISQDQQQPKFALTAHDFFLAACTRSCHTLWSSLSRVLTSAEEPAAASFLVTGLCTVLANPVYSATTTLRGSQRVITSANEAVDLLWFLCVCPGTQDAAVAALARACLESAAAPDKFGGAAALVSLLRVVLRGLDERRFVGDCQAAMWILLLLSARPEFIESLRTPLTAASGVAALPSLESFVHSGKETLGDVLVLALCEISCPAAPRWLIPITELTCSVLANTVPNLGGLLELTQFEIFHLLEWVTGAFLSVQRKSVSQDACVLAMVDLVVGAATARPLSFLPLVASLAAEVRISERLRKLVDAPVREAHLADTSQDQSFGHQLSAHAADEVVGGDPAGTTVAARMAPTYRAGQALHQALPVGAFAELERTAIERMNAASAKTKTTTTGVAGGGGGGGGGDDAAAAGAGADADAGPYAPLQAAVPFFGGSGGDDSSEIMIRALQPSMELLRWGIAHSWAIVIQGNVACPIFDVTRCKMFN